MNKKRLMNKLNSQKGITGADVIMAMTIIIVTIGVIASVYINLVIGSKEVDRKTGATRIVTNILENMSMIYYDEIDANLETLRNLGIATKEESTYTISGGGTDKIFKTTIPTGYTIKIDVTNSYGNQGSLQYDLVKKVNVSAEYLVNSQVKNVSMTKVFEREIVRECNSPNFDDEYIKQMIPADEYIMYSSTAKDAAGVKVVCPIKYDIDTNSYKIITNIDSIWYSYSNKQWARVLILDPADLSKPITKELLTSEKSYVWIPRYGVEAGGNLFGDTHFKYKQTDYSIINSYENEELVYNFIDINPVNWSTSQGISEENILGKWCRYSDLTQIGTDAYNLNNSQIRSNG